jgi:hypothetical protein
MGTKKKLKRLRRQQAEDRAVLPADPAKRQFRSEQIPEGLQDEAELMLRESARSALDGRPREHLEAKRRAKVARAIADELAEVDAGTTATDFDTKVQKPSKTELDNNPEDDEVAKALQYAAVLIDAADAVQGRLPDPEPTA